MALSMARAATLMAVFFGVVNSLECSEPACSVPVEPEEANLLQHSAHRGLAVQRPRAHTVFAAAPQGGVADGCHLTHVVSDGCPPSQMMKDVPNLVYPGGSAICIDNSPYAFQVFLGSSRKLVLFFQGGGVCVDFNTTFGQPTCDQKVELGADGIFDRSESSLFKDHTIVYISYCSGDLHAGNRTVRFKEDPEGRSVLQMGYWNAKSAVDWALAHFGTLDSLVIAGCSAGSIGSHLWSSYLLKLFETRVSGGRAVVLAGSAIPAGTVNTLFRLFGMCDLPIFSAEIREKCTTNQIIMLMDHVEETMVSFPSVPYATLTSKTDQTQIKFFNLLGPLINVDPLDDAGFTAFMNKLFDELNKFPNWVSYIVEGHDHCFLPRTYLNTTDTRGIDTAGEPFDTCQVGHHVKCPVSGNNCSGAQCCPIVPGVAEGGTFPCPSAPDDFRGCVQHTKVSNCLRQPPTLVDWVKDHLLGGKAVASECTGELVVDYEGGGTTYCSARQAGKVFHF